MDLEDYIHKTLTQITNGVHKAQQETPLYIAPGYVEHEKQTGAQLVNFEISTVVSSEAGGGIKVWSIGDAKANHKNEGAHKISFSVPVYFQAPTERSPNHYSNKKEG